MRENVFETDETWISERGRKRFLFLVFAWVMLKQWNQPRERERVREIISVRVTKPDKFSILFFPKSELLFSLSLSHLFCSFAFSLSLSLSLSPYFYHKNFNEKPFLFFLSFSLSFSLYFFSSFSSLTLSLFLPLSFIGCLVFICFHDGLGERERERGSFTSNTAIAFALLAYRCLSLLVRNKKE